MVLQEAPPNRPGRPVVLLREHEQALPQPRMVVVIAAEVSRYRRLVRSRDPPSKQSRLHQGAVRHRHLMGLPLMPLQSSQLASPGVPLLRVNDCLGRLLQ